MMLKNMNRKKRPLIQKRFGRQTSEEKLSSRKTSFEMNETP